MIRTQVQLTEAQAARLKQLAAEQGTSIATIIREALDRLFEDRERDRLWDRALAAAGAGSSGTGDLGREHDRYLDDAFSE